MRGRLKGGDIMSVVCRFKVSGLEVATYGGDEARYIKMGAVQDKVFGPATPSAKVEMLIVPKESWEQFELGKTYSVVFTKE